MNKLLGSKINFSNKKTNLQKEDICLRGGASKHRLFNKYFFGIMKTFREVIEKKIFSMQRNICIINIIS